ncbi:FAD-dependent oxidoreductase [Phycicoccus sp. MAQZ13P-2]|uniref:FAD-dependent oxidoreductase n=1 Tax=Phycicoccus mangrovi TaxID=2840470 RepID=UPI001C008A29|nr:FAD-dependent oxidoreductase [Phycicoccus mangrovi]MBT9256397.1 FAD-dependent oxidoreductase [Phycicoccus mangrovi]MBT9275935.1 FAD-dependent oxidoreductase [Phycicoccus mangrovi]
MQKIVIIGGVAGGMSAATRLRRLDEEASITVVERSGHVSFANCGLPYHLGGVIEKRSSLLLQTPESLAARFAIDVRVRHEARAIDRANRRVTVRDLATDEDVELEYDALVLSPGARPVVPRIPGISVAHTLRDIEDLDHLVASARDAREAVVVGGGFIGVEVAENLVHRGVAVTLVEATDQVMAPLDPEMVEPVHDAMRAAGVRLALGVSVVRIDPGEPGEPHLAHLSDGRAVPAGLVVAAIGVRPETSLAAAAGLALGERGGILVDDSLRTSDPAVFAVGDAVEKRDGLDASSVLVPLANTANRQGRVVADVIAGRPGVDRPVLGTAIVEVFGVAAAAVGWNEKRLREAGRPHRVIHTHPGSHAGYYPGAEAMALKLLVDPGTDEILGAQAVGRDGVDKRIDVVATAMAGRLTAGDLADLELAYAPQFGSAKDPVNMLGWVDRAVADGDVETLQWHELDGALAAGATLVDVRSPREHAVRPVPGAVNIPVDDLRARLEELPDGPLVVHCEVGLRGYVAARLLAQHGRSVRNLDGGYRTWAAGTAGQRTAERVGAPA